MNYSVIIPLFNKESHIKRAINSVLEQTYPHFEIIIIDDGSTDNSFEEASKISDPRIRIIRQNNLGVSAARNRGALDAKFDWLAFLDADDEWTSGFLASITELHYSFPNCGLLGSSYIHFREGGLDDSHKRRIRYPNGWMGILSNYYEDLPNYPFCSSTVALRKELLFKAGGFPENLHKGEDTYLWINLYQFTNFAFSNTVGGIYHLEAKNRSSPDPTIINGNPKKPYSHAFTINSLIQEKKIPPHEIQAAIDYMALYDIPISRQLLTQGYRSEVLRRLWLYRSTKQFRKEWIRLFAKSLIPQVFLDFYHWVIQLNK